MKWQNITTIVGGSTISIFFLLALITNLSGVSDVSDSGSSYCLTDCEAYINFTTTYWEFCFEHNNDSDLVYKKMSRSRRLWINMDKIDEMVVTEPKIQTRVLVPTYGGKWRELKEGDCWSRTTKANPLPVRLKIEGSKEHWQTVKWSFLLDHYLTEGINIDPIWYGTDFNCTNCLSNVGDNTTPYTTFNLTPRFTFTTNTSAYCNMSLDNISYSVCEGTGNQSHNCTLPKTTLMDLGGNDLYIQCNTTYWLFNMSVNISLVDYSAGLCSDIETIYFQLPANDTTGMNVTADGQWNENCTINITNSGSSAGVVKMWLDSSSVNHSMWADDDCTRAGATNLTVWRKTINSSLAVGNSTVICLWMDFLTATKTLWDPIIYLDLWNTDDKVS